MKDASQVQEPCFQSKKRLEGPASSLSTSDFANSNEDKEDYILLGKNDKFQQNIQYKCRTLKRLNTEDDQNETSQPTSQEVVNDYVLLGNNSKFIKNTVYKPKPCPEVIIVNGKSKDNFQMTDQPLSVLSNFGDEYMLLGNNAKFSDNIVYKPKMWREFNPSHGKENEPAEDTEYSQVQVKKLEPAPFVDTSKFREPPKKSKKSVEKDDDSELKIKKKKKSSAIQEESREDLKLPLDDLSSRKETIKEKTKAKGGASNNPEVSEEKAVKFQSPPAAPRSPKENDKRLLALLHKAGIHLPPRSLMEQSEYQKNFTWKSPEPNSTGKENKKNFQTSTLLDSYTYIRDSIPRTTEYQRSFQAWAPLSSKPASPPAIVEKKIVQTEPIVPTIPKRPALKPPRIEKTSSPKPSSPLLKEHQVKNTAPDQGLQDQPDSGPGVCSDEIAAKIQQEDVKKTVNFESPSDPATKTPKFVYLNSEYSANFKAPSKYDYMNNVWDGAASPSEQTPPKDNSGKGDWYSEVCELRRKAAEYRRRANNTHFCADHMGQLLSTETKLWERMKSDKSTTPEVNLTALRPAGIIYNKHYLQSPKISQRLSPYDFDPEPQIILEDVDDIDYDDDNNDVVSVHSKQKQEPAINHDPPSSEINVAPPPSIEENAEGSAPAEEEESSTGRIPTPELQQQHIKRHHLDRTTPTKGGILISPAINRKKVFTDRPSSPIVAIPADDIKSSNHSPASDVEEKPKHCVKTCALPSKSNCQRTFGKPSKDTHVLRSEEELLSSSKPLSKSSSEQPAQIMSQDRSNITLRSGGNRRPKKSNTKLHPAGLLSDQRMPEPMASTYRVLPVKVHADKNNSSDFLSQSLESNSSLASEILERTRKRLDFW